VRRGRLGFAYRLVILIAQPFLYLLTKRDWRGKENVPPAGGFIVAANHVSHVDPFILAHALYRMGRAPRYLAKSELWKVPIVKWVLSNAHQIPVHRRTTDAALALRDAVAALESGECLAVYPEGTTTKDPAYWPMIPKTGVARLALMTGMPVIPVGQWGAQAIFGQDRKLHLLPRHTVHVHVGPPVDLSAYAGKPLDSETLRAATSTIMGEIRRLVGEIRGEDPPAVAYDPQTARREAAQDAQRERRSA
jgi:1-acyl-sn-glycerol-3-phosphate acyltransferase